MPSALQIAPLHSSAAISLSPRLSVVIVNYRQWENAAALVRQVLESNAGRAGVAEVVVVDNHSPPHRLISKLRRWPGVSLRRWKQNRGFARAVNEGCRLSRGDWFLLLNPDITLADGFIDRACALAEHLAATEPQRGVIGFQLRNRDGSRQLSVGRFPTLANLLVGQLLPRARRKYRRVLSPRRCSVPWATGCCLLIRRDCLQAVGGFDADYFLYYEDVDFCQRVRSAGWKVAFEPALAAVHHQPLHDRVLSLRMRLITRHGLLTYARKHWPGWQAWLLAQGVRLEGWLRGQWGSDPAHRQMMRMAHAFARGRPGQARRIVMRGDGKPQAS